MTAGYCRSSEARRTLALGDANQEHPATHLSQSSLIPSDLKHEPDLFLIFTWMGVDVNMELN